MDHKQQNPPGRAAPEAGCLSVACGADDHRNKLGAAEKQECDYEALARKAEPPGPPEPSGEDADELSGEPDFIITPEPPPQSYKRPAAPRPGGLYKVSILVSSAEGYPCGQLPILTSRAGLAAITRAAKAHGVARNTDASRGARGRVNAV
jgi:hypothetical protein